METFEKLPTWEEILEMKPQIIKDWYYEGVRCLILVGPSSLCAYVGIPENHPLAGFEYDDIPMDCHGGLTFSGKGDGTLRSAGFYWYGWDYSHSGDYAFYYDKHPLLGFDRSTETKWDAQKVLSDMWGAIYDFKRLMKLAEKIKNS